MLGPAGELVNIKSNKIYSNNKSKLIFSLHCTKTNECPVFIKPQGSEGVNFPPGSFIRGAVYHIYIEQLKFDEDKASFVGYRLI